MMALTGLALILSWSGPRLLAQDQQPVEIQQTVGPYTVGVLTERSNLSVGRARFIITLEDGITGEPITGAQIVIHIKSQASRTEGFAAAYGVPKFPGTYNAQVRLDTPGVHLVSIQIQGSLGEGTVLVEPFQVPDVGGYSSGSFVFVGLTLVLVLGAGYVWWSAARRKKLMEFQSVSRIEAMGQTHETPKEDGSDGEGR